MTINTTPVGHPLATVYVGLLNSTIDTIGILYLLATKEGTGSIDPAMIASC